MTRRKFIQKLIKAGSAIIVVRLGTPYGGTWCLARRAARRVCDTSRQAPRKFVRAVRLKKYPGLLRPLRDIRKQSKWSG